jgi:hypothetical protein
LAASVYNIAYLLEVHGATGGGWIAPFRTWNDLTRSTLLENWQNSKCTMGENKLTNSYDYTCIAFLVLQNLRSIWTFSLVQTSNNVLAITGYCRAYFNFKQWQLYKRQSSRTKAVKAISCVSPELSRGLHSEIFIPRSIQI